MQAKTQLLLALFGVWSTVAMPETPAPTPEPKPDQPGSAIIFRGGAERRGYFDGPDFMQPPKKDWRQKIGDHIAIGEVAIAEKRVFFTTLYGRIFALDSDDGHKLWKAGEGNSPISVSPIFISGGPPIFATPTLAGEELLYTHSAGKKGSGLFALNTATGERVWEFFPQTRLTASPVPGDDYYLVASDEGTMMRVDKRTRNIVWQTAIGKLAAREFSVSGDSVLACTDQGLVHVALKDGTVRWTHKLGGLYCTTPAIAEGVAVVTLHVAGVADLFNQNKLTAKMIAVLRLADAELLWKIDASRTPRIAAIADGTVYFCPGNAYFYAVDLHSGKLRWKTWLKGGLETSNPSLTAKSVYFTTDDRKLVALNRADGKLRWVLDKEFSVDVAPVPSGNTLYVLTLLGSVMALR